MPKLTNYNPPAEYADKLAQLLTLQAAVEYGYWGRGKKKTRYVKWHSRRPNLYRQIEGACEELARRLGYSLFTDQGKAFVQQRTEEIKRGFFDPLYWTQCTIEDTEWFSCIPICSPWYEAPESPYRDLLNWPTQVTYPDGQPDVPPLTFHGETISEFFNDTLWLWGRRRFKLATPFAPGVFEPIILSLAGTLDVQASHRPSRPMFSVLAKSYLGANTNPDFSTLRPPLTKAISFYWRYRPKKAVPPYYNASLDRIMYAVLNTRSTYQPFVQPTHCCVTFANRPMRGKAYNNNTTVHTESNILPILYMIRPAPIETSAPMGYEFGTTLWTYDRLANAWDIHQTQDIVTQFAVHEERFLTYSGNDTLAVQGADFQYLNIWPNPVTPPLGFWKISPSPWGFSITARDFGAPETWHVWHYDPDGAPIADYSMPSPTLATGGWAFHQGYGPHGILWGLDPTGFSNSAYIWTQGGTYAGEVHAPGQAIARLLPSRNGLWAIALDDRIYFWPWPASIEPVTYPTVIDNFSDLNRLTVPPYDVAPVDDGLFFWFQNGSNYFLSDIFTVTYGPVMPAHHPGTAYSVNLHLLQ
jgi:hypothetical protein